MLPSPVTLTQRRHYGLYNQGATCYLNSVLQVLSMTTEIHDRLDPTTKQMDLHLTNIFEGLKEATCGTETITTAFGIQNVYEQRDAAECLEMILRKISPQASKAFQGALRRTRKCSRGHKIIEETNEFWTLPLSLKDTHDSSYSVERSFERIFKSKSFNGGNLVYCNDCEETTEAESECEMVSPQILTLLLKRFDDYNTGTYFKSDCCVEVPRELQRNNKTYELYAMVNHFGSLRGGHYTATVLSNEDKTWYEFNDTHVYKVKEPFAETNSYNSRTVYLLTYRDAAQRLQSRLHPGNGSPLHAGQRTGWCYLSSLISFFWNAARKWRIWRLLWKWLPDLTLTQRRHYGLYNQGATCYLNSVLQVLSMTTEIHDRLDPRAKQMDLHLTNIFEGLKEATCGTETITTAFGIQNIYEQQDAAECLEMILRKISPQASEVFQGALRDTRKCSRGHKIIEETNPFWTLPLSLNDTHDSSYSVESSFERIFQSKSFNGRNLVYCNDCEKKTEAESECEMVVSPQVLTLLLKRFDFDYNTGTYFKSDRCVEVPRELQRNNKTYELYAMVNHIGSLRGEHYTATVLSNEDNTWYEFNDTDVYKVKEQPFAETNSYNSRTVYLLMYRDAAPAAQKRRLQSYLNPGNGSPLPPSEQQPGRNSQTNPTDMVVQVLIRGLRGTMMTMDLCDTVEQFMSITVLQLKEKIIERLDDIVLREDQLILMSSACRLKDDRFLSDCGIQNMSTIDVVLRLPGGGLPPEEGDGGMGDKGGTNRSMEHLVYF
ncbi:uncharacterized protein LOC142950945 isoform X6 [Anarhichas minor]